MKKRILCGVLALGLLLGACGCQNTTAQDQPVSTAKTTAEQTAAKTTVSPYVMNPLTGVYDLPREKKDQRPVAVMINNLRSSVGAKSAQTVQTGLNQADMVFETMAEGGITRLMAVYSDIEKAGQIGTVRSARYSYAQLACGLDAVYVHCGADNLYATPLMQELGMDRLDLISSASSAGERVDNGLAYEHTLYTSGEALFQYYDGLRTEIKDRAKDIYSFNKKDVTYTKPALQVNVRFSSNYKSSFTYDANTKKYTRGDDGTVLKDYMTGEKEQFKNVLVLYAPVYYMSDNYHVKTVLDSGKGLYFTNGSCCEIRWEKGNSTAALRFQDADGNPLSLNAGNSYICLTDTNNEQYTVIA